MKTHYIPMFLPWIALVSLHTPIASAQPVLAAGHVGGNGGDPTEVRIRRIRKYINLELRHDLLAYFRDLNVDSIANQPVREALGQMKNQAVHEDIGLSDYDLKATCRDIGGRPGGGAVLDDLGGPICFSPARLAEIGSPKLEILGLAVHEHAHHFGKRDLDSAIYETVLNTAHVANPEWGDATGPVVPAPGPRLLQFQGVWRVSGGGGPPFTTCASRLTVQSSTHTIHADYVDMPGTPSGTCDLRIGSLTYTCSPEQTNMPLQCRNGIGSMESVLEIPFSLDPRPPTFSTWFVHNPHNISFFERIGN